ncbi:MAG TPA: NrfD/PsrC family molybdoenzyme membrane anchor subunit [Nitrososphaerales archaeon]
MVDYIFPNEFVEWTILIVNYPFITGLVAGSFILSSLTYVFGKEQFRSISKLALLTSLSFLLISVLPLLAHLQQPSRATEMLFRPNLSSAMAMFGFILLAFIVLTTMEALFLFREGFIKLQASSKGVMKNLYRVLSLGSVVASKSSIERDNKMVKTLAMIGIPLSLLFTGYVGFMFGTIKANPIWLTPLNPVIFILSALVSGIALVSFVYVVATKLTGGRISVDVIASLATYIGWFLIIDLSMTGLEVAFRAYEQSDSWYGVSKTLFDVNIVPYLGLEIILGGVVPLILLAIPSIRKSIAGVLLISALVLQGVHAMRYTVIIGAQLLSKTGEGFLTYVPPLFGRESYMTTISIYAMGFFIMLVLLSVFPWREVEVQTK